MINNQLHPHFSRNYNSPNSFQGKLCFNQLFDQPMPELDPKFKEIVSKDWTEEISKIKTSQTTDQERYANCYNFLFIKDNLISLFTSFLVQL